MSTHTTSTVRTRVAAGLVALSLTGLTAACGVDEADGTGTYEPAARHPRKVTLHHSPTEAERRAAQHDSRFHGAR
jgi:hypothetical protein